MGAAVADIADAIVTELNADPHTNFGVTFDASRSFAEWDESLEDLDTLHVDVVPSKWETLLLDRGDGTGATTNIRHSVTMQIVVRKRFSRQSNERFRLGDIDAMLLLLQRINDFFVQNEPVGVSNANWSQSRIAAGYTRDHLRNNGQYTGVVEITCDVDV